MPYYEVFIADSQYRRDEPLTYSSEEELKPGAVVTVELRTRNVTGFVLKQVNKPTFAVKPIKKTVGTKTLPPHCLELAHWLKDYYACSLGEALRQFAPSRPTLRAKRPEFKEFIPQAPEQLGLEMPLTDEQQKALTKIKQITSTTVVLHGETGSGKTRVYLELAAEKLAAGQSVILLTPEISLTSQLAHITAAQLKNPIFVLHSRLSEAKRKQVWLQILEASEPIVVIGPRSALFSPVHNLGLIVIDEAHEPAYKQEQGPRYHASRVASQLGVLTGAKVVLGSATPSITDYYLAEQHQALVRMKKQAVSGAMSSVVTDVIDMRDRINFTGNPYLSNRLLDVMHTTLAAKKQVMIYLNRRGSARLILCDNCGWQLLCPNCDVPLIYHGDSHLTRCHICGHSQKPPVACPVCANPDVVYRSIGTKALVEAAAKLFPEYRIARFDSDNAEDEAAHALYYQMHRGEVDIIIGTQLLAKGFDLPKLGLVGVVAAESSLALPDFTSEERTFQLLYQIIGRVGRGHTKGQVIVQSYNPQNTIIKAAIDRDYGKFYKQVLAERQAFRFPPFSYLMKLVCRRATLLGAERTAYDLKKKLAARPPGGGPVEIAGPAPAFYARRGKNYCFQLVLKGKNRDHLVALARDVPANWTIDLDPADLL